MKKKLKALIKLANDDWVFKVNLMLDDFKKLEKRVEDLEKK